MNPRISRRSALLLAGAAPLVLAGCGTQLPEAPRSHAETIYDPFWYWFDHHYAYYYRDDDDGGPRIDWPQALEDYWDGLSDTEKQEVSEKMRDWVAANRPGLTGREEIIAALSDDIRDTARTAWNDLSPAERTAWRSRLDAARESGTLPGVVEGTGGIKANLSAGDRARISDAIRSSRQARLGNREVQRVAPPRGGNPRPVSRIPRSRGFRGGFGGRRGFGGGRGGRGR